MFKMTSRSHLAPSTILLNISSSSSSSLCCPPIRLHQHRHDFEPRHFYLRFIGILVCQRRRGRSVVRRPGHVWTSSPKTTSLCNIKHGHRKYVLKDAVFSGETKSMRIILDNSDTKSIIFQAAVRVRLWSAMLAAIEK